MQNMAQYFGQFRLLKFMGKGIVIVYTSGECVSLPFIFLKIKKKNENFAKDRNRLNI